MRRGKLTVIASVLALSLSACAQQVATPPVGTVSISDTWGRASAAEDAAHPAAYPGTLPTLPLPADRQRLFQAGDTNALELPVDAPLAEAYRAYFAGEGEAALSALAAAGAESPLKRFHLSAQKVRTLIMMGRAAEAESETADTALLERAVLGTEVNALALRAEARLWLGDYDAAEADALTVAAALQNWVLPHSFGGPPTNMAEIVLLTTAQLRAYTVLSGLYVLRNEGDKALPWAEAAERGYNTVHTVAADSLYGIYFKSYPESYYGRAFNILFRGAASALTAGDFAAGAEDFSASRSYFDSIGYRAGSVSVAALESWALYALGQDRDRALAVSEEAVQLAADSGFPDFIWRISTLRGEILLDQGRLADAETAFRRADASVDLVTGALATDRAKLRFGVGKETIIRRLAWFDAQAGNMDRLFTDLERARARAFVDMLADRPVARGRGGALVETIRELDDAIRQARIRALAPRGAGEGLEGEIERLMAERHDAVDRLRQTDPDLADVHAVRAASLADIRSRLGEEGALLYTLPVAMDETIKFLVVDSTGAGLRQSGATAGEIRETLIQFREAVQLGRASMQRRLLAQLQRQLQLGQWRIHKRLYVVPSGDMYFIPWGALPDLGRVAVIPNGGWLLRDGMQSVEGGQVGLVGDPQFGGALPQLDGARQEVETLASMFNTKPMIGAEATVSGVRQAIGDRAKVLHFATHGTFDAHSPLKSALYLSDGTGPDPLTAADIFEDPLSADLVVLSACETGLGEAVAGDDFLGLARSFYLGGADTVLYSLWPISDEGTREFMTAFYRHVRYSNDPVLAWADATARLREEGYPPSVYGAFIVGGAVR